MSAKNRTAFAKSVSLAAILLATCGGFLSAEDGIMDFDTESAKSGKITQIERSGADAVLSEMLKDTADSSHKILSATESAVTAIISVGGNNAVLSLGADSSKWIEKLPRVIRLLSDKKKSGEEIFSELSSSGIPLGEIPASNKLSEINKAAPNVKSEFFRTKIFAGGCVNRVIVPETTFWIEIFGAEEIGFMAFMESSVMSIKLPAGVRKIGAFAFSRCFHIESVTIPDGTEILEKAAFHACESLKSVKIPASVREIEEEAFYWCLELESIEFSGTVAEWESVKKGDGWNGEVPAKFVQCSDGKAELEGRDEEEENEPD